MHIAIDASRTTVAARTGTENYALQLIRALIDLRPAHRITLYFRDKPHPNLFNTYPNVQRKLITTPRLWTHIGFARELWRERPTVTFVPSHTLPFYFPGRAVVTVHDLGYRFFPEAHPRPQRAYLDRTTRYSARRATRVITDSVATMRDLMGEYGTDDQKIDVVYPGVEALQPATPARIAAVRRKYRLPERYLFFLGTLQPRKNIVRLAEAFAQYLANGGGADESLHLVLAGKRGWLVDDVLSKLPESAKPRIHFTGYVEDDDVAGLYTGSLGFCFPSLYEGFGFPVLEAMRCGSPVLCSNTSSLPELAGDAAILVDPLDVNAIADGMHRLVSDESLRRTLIQRGNEQVKKFTWQRAAIQTLQTLEKAGR
ncbi:MAG: glycosyltransferase family 4 protein [Anaerolineae bacterium]|nr:glycosyltransferase family 4 protein [Anaerolineae bacterium]